MMKRCRWIAALMTAVMLLGQVGMTTFAEEIPDTEVVLTEETVCDEAETSVEETETHGEEIQEEIQIEETETGSDEVQIEETETIVEEAPVEETESEDIKTEEKEAETEETEEAAVEEMALTGRISDLKAYSQTNGVRLTWSKVPGATGYLITGIRGDHGKYGMIGNTTNLTYTDAKALSNEYNFYWVFPYVKDSAGKMTSGMASTKYVFGFKKLSMISNFSAVSCFHGAMLTWSKVDGAEGYIIYGIRNAGKYGKIGITTGTTYVDTLAPIEGYSFYWVIPYNKLKGKLMVGAFPKYKYAKTYYAYSGDDVKYVNDKVTIVPKHIYYDSKNKRMVAECYIANGKSKAVTNLSVAELTLKSTSGTVICTKKFGGISVGTIEAKQYANYTFYFEQASIKSYVGPKTMSYFAKVNYDIK